MAIQNGSESDFFGRPVNPDGTLGAPSRKIKRFCKRKYVLEGTKVGRWSVLECLGRENRWGTYVYRCRCECGTERVISVHQLVPRKHKDGRPGSQSCGCLMRDTNSAKVKHGQFKNGRKGKEWRTWCSMRRRCRESLRYVERGITVCERWDRSFDDFLADVGLAPGDGYTLDRFPDREGNYEPGNVRWATAAEQSRNTSRTHRITFNGETRCLSEWSSILGIAPGTILRRLRRGLPVELVLLARSEPDVGREGVNSTSVVEAGVAPIPSVSDAPELRPVMLTLDGETLTLTQWAERIGIPDGTLRRRVMRGWPPEKVLQGRLPRRGLRLTLNGETLTLVEWSERLGVPRHVLYTRHRAGMPVEEVLKPSRKVDRVTLTHQGQTLTLNEWSEKIGVPAPTIYERLKRGLPMERVLHPALLCRRA